MRSGSSPTIGDVLCEKWRILRVLGAGGMATVFEASHRNGKRVAIKILHPELRANAHARARFLREGYIANRVDHPNVPSVLDDGETSDGDAFLVMDLLQGETLDSRSKAGRIGLREVADISLSILEALSAAHEKGIVHRDIKPSNVFLAVDGSVKLLDFGIARMREALPEQDSVTLSRGVFALGTPSFMAPEQARGHWEEVDSRTDIWSMGALMFALLTGRHVHEGKTTNELMILSATAPAPLVASIRSDLPASLARVVDRALSFHRELRWADARAMRDAIRALGPQGEKSGLAEAVMVGQVKSPERPATATTFDQLSAVVEVPSTTVGQTRRQLSRPWVFALVAVLLPSSISVVWLLASESSRPVNSATHAVAPSGSGQSHDKPSPQVTPPIARIDDPVPPSPNPELSATAVLDVPRKSRAPAAVKASAAAVPAMLSSAAFPSEVPTPRAAPSELTGDAWLESQK
jgi:eukaryotic-like serine/threonine-protein kinase